VPNRLLCGASLYLRLPIKISESFGNPNWPRGGTVDHIKTQLDNLSNLSDEEVSELQNSIVGEFDTLSQTDRTPESVDGMTTLADMLDTVRDEVSRRSAQAEELANRAAEAALRVKGEDSEATMEPADDSADADEVITASADAETAETELAVDEPTEAAEAPEADAELAVEEVTEAPAEEDAPAADEAPAETEEAATELAAEDEVAEAPTEEATELAAEDAPVEETTPDAELAVEETAEEATDEADASPSEENTSEQTAQEEAPVTAAAEESFEAPADRRPVVSATVAPVAITAGADIPGITAGSTLTDMTAVSEAMTERLRTLRSVTAGDGEQHVVASLRTEYPESRVLTQDANENADKFDKVTGPAALMASGGFATPLAPSYDIFGLGTDARPVRDALPSFQATRGGIRYITPPVLSAYAGAVGVWTNANDTSAVFPNSGNLAKNSLTVGSASENTAYVDAITLQLQFGNLLTRAFPELIKRHNELALIQHARLAELTLLSKINAASTQVTSSSLIGAARDILVNVKRAAAAMRSRHRIDVSTQLRAIMPSWVLDAMAADLTLNMPGDNNLAVSAANINAMLASSNVTITWSIDQNSFGAQSGSAAALLEFPDSFTWFLFAEGTFVFLDGGTLDIGIIRDSALVSTNDYKMFTETFEGLAMLGIESLAVTSTINVNGSAAALRDTTGGATAAAIEF
jgi:chemotaxis protein histidine kinase CheA